MASYLKNLSDYDADTVPSASDMKFGICVADYHQEITHALLRGAYEKLLQHGCSEQQIHTIHVPGAYELPFGAQIVYDKHLPDAVITLGCVIKGETSHDQYINQSVSMAIMQLGLRYSKPFVFGLLTPNTEEQALARAGGQHGNKGVEAAVTAIKMVHLNSYREPKSTGFNL